MEGLARRAWTGFEAGLLMGVVVTGIGGRLTMRLIALGQDRVPAFTLTGSLVVVAAGTAFAGGAGLLYGLVRERLPGHGWMRGLLFSVVLQAVLWAVGFPLPPVPPGGRFVRGDAVARAAFVVLFLLAGLALEAAHALLRRRGAESLRPADSGSSERTSCA